MLKASKCQNSRFILCAQPAKFRICGKEAWQVEYLCFKHKLGMEEALEKGEKK
jgi:hypothetical protein